MPTHTNRKKCVIPLVISLLGLFAAIVGDGLLSPGICGTCWDNDEATCIIQGIKIDDACDAATPGCLEPQET